MAGGESDSFIPADNPSNLGGTENTNNDLNLVNIMGSERTGNDRTEPVASTTDSSDQTTDSAENAVEAAEAAKTPEEGLTGAADRFGTGFSGLDASLNMTGDPDGPELRNNLSEWVEHHAADIARAAGAAAGAGFSAVFSGIMAGTGANKALENIFPRQQ